MSTTTHPRLNGRQFARYISNMSPAKARAFMRAAVSESEKILEEKKFSEHNHERFLPSVLQVLVNHFHNCTKKSSLMRAKNAETALQNEDAYLAAINKPRERHYDRILSALSLVKTES